MPWKSSRGLHARLLASRFEPRANACRNALPVETDMREQERGIAVIDERVGQTEMQDRHDNVPSRERFGNRAPRAAGNHALLDRDDRVVILHKTADEIDVDRLDEAHVDD